MTTLVNNVKAASRFKRTSNIKPDSLSSQNGPASHKNGQVSNGREKNNQLQQQQTMNRCCLLKCFANVGPQSSLNPEHNVNSGLQKDEKERLRCNTKLSDASTDTNITNSTISDAGDSVVTVATNPTTSSITNPSGSNKMTNLNPPNLSPKDTEYYAKQTKKRQEMLSDAGIAKYAEEIYQETISSELFRSEQNGKNISESAQNGSKTQPIITDLTLIYPALATRMQDFWDVDANWGESKMIDVCTAHVWLAMEVEMDGVKSSSDKNNSSDHHRSRSSSTSDHHRSRSSSSDKKGNPKMRSRASSFPNQSRSSLSSSLEDNSPDSESSKHSGITKQTSGTTANTSGPPSGQKIASRTLSFSDAASRSLANATRTLSFSRTSRASKQPSEEGSSPTYTNASVNKGQKSGQKHSEELKTTKQNDSSMSQQSSMSHQKSRNEKSERKNTKRVLCQSGELKYYKPHLIPEEGTENFKITVMSYENKRNEVAEFAEKIVMKLAQTKRLCILSVPMDKSFPGADKDKVNSSEKDKVNTDCTEPFPDSNNVLRLSWVQMVDYCGMLSIPKLLPLMSPSIMHMGENMCQIQVEFSECRVNAARNAAETGNKKEKSTRSSEKAQKSDLHPKVSAKSTTGGFWLESKLHQKNLWVVKDESDGGFKMTNPPQWVDTSKKRSMKVAMPLSPDEAYFYVPQVGPALGKLLKVFTLKNLSHDARCHLIDIEADKFHFLNDHRTVVSRGERASSC